MIIPNICLHGKNQLALEEVIKEEANRIINRGIKEKIVDNSIGLIRDYGVPNAIAAIIGYIGGGPEGAISAMKQVSIGVLPILATLKGIHAIKKKRFPIDDINKVIEQIKPEIIYNLIYTENLPKSKGKLFKSALINGLGYVATSGITGLATGIDFNYSLLFATGANDSMNHSALRICKAKDWKKRIADYAKNNPEKCVRKKGSRLDLENLENILRSAIIHSEETHKIFLSSDGKGINGLEGLAGFFGSVDALNDKHRDSSKVRPNVTLDIKNPHNHSLEFAFEYAPDMTKTELALDIARYAYAQSNGVKVKFMPFFEKAPLEKFLSQPYEHLSSLVIYGEKEECSHFKIKCNFQSDYRQGKMHVEINSKEYICLVLDLFKSLRKRQIEKEDFDPDLIKLSEEDQGINTKLEVGSNRDGTPVYIDTLDSLTPKGMGYVKKIEYNEQIEEPLANIKFLGKTVKSIYDHYMHKIENNQYIIPSMGILFQGILYSLTPIRDTEKSIKNNILRLLISHPSNLKSVVRDRELTPSLESARVYAQIPAITKENIFGVIREIDKSNKGIEIDPYLHTMDFATFYNIPGNSIVKPNTALIRENLSHIEVIDEKGSLIEIRLGDSLQSYEKIKKEQFPDGEVAIQEEIEKRQFFDRARLKTQLENPTYEVITANGIPEHVNIYNPDDSIPLIQNRNVKITTNMNEMFERMPVHPTEGIDRVTRLLSQIRDATYATNSTQ